MISSLHPRKTRYGHSKQGTAIRGQSRHHPDDRRGLPPAHLLHVPPLQQEADIGIKLPSDSPPAEDLKLPSEHIVEVFPNGLILLNGSPTDSNNNRDMPRLTRTLSRLKQSSDRAGIDTVVKVQADPDSPHQRSIDVLNACSKAEIKKVSFAAYGL